MIKLGRIIGLFVWGAWDAFDAPPASETADVGLGDLYFFTGDF